eukprot:344807-Hanusia_phi.AAC.18
MLMRFQRCASELTVRECRSKPLKYGWQAEGRLKGGPKSGEGFSNRVARWVRGKKGAVECVDRERQDLLCLTKVASCRIFGVRGSFTDHDEVEHCEMTRGS